MRLGLEENVLLARQVCPKDPLAGSQIKLKAAQFCQSDDFFFQGVMTVPRSGGTLFFKCLGYYSPCFQPVPERCGGHQANPIPSWPVPRSGSPIDNSAREIVLEQQVITPEVANDPTSWE